MTDFTTLIDTESLAARLDDARLVLVDCRHNLSDTNAGEKAYRAGHIPGALFLHIDRDLSGPITGSNGRHPLPAAADFAATLSRIGVHATTQVVAYDQNTGMWASRLWWMLRWVGHPLAAVLDGGLDKWIAEGRPVSTAVPWPRPGHFEARLSPSAVSADQILAQLGNGSMTVLDARAPERYRGDMEPIDKVAGHIPGALNRPYTSNLSADGGFKSAQALRHEFEAQLDGRAPGSVVHQCGSGVTACHNVLAMEVAGLHGSRLYPGSWSEWSADPSRPIARGNGSPASERSGS